MENKSAFKIGQMVFTRDYSELLRVAGVDWDMNTDSATYTCSRTDKDGITVSEEYREDQLFSAGDAREFAQSALDACAERVLRARIAESHVQWLTDSDEEPAQTYAVEDPNFEHCLQFFVFEHLPPHLAEVSREFSNLAHAVIQSLPRNPERTVALRKLLEAKDAAVRALVAK